MDTKHQLIYSSRFLLFLGFLLVACGGSSSQEIQTVSPDSAIPAPTIEPPTAIPPTATLLPPTVVSPTNTPPKPTVTPPQEEVTVIEEVLYARAVDPMADDQYLDIYVPGSPGHFPVVVWAHGSDQDKSTGKTVARILAKQGFVVLSIDWQDGSISRDVDNVARLLREATENGECALSYVSDQADQYGADPEVIWAGFSAGAYLGSLLSFSDAYYESAWESYATENDGQPTAQVECAAETEPAPIIAYVANSGPFPEALWFDGSDSGELPAEMLALRDVSAIGKNMDLRVRLIHGSFDITTPLVDAQRFHAALIDAGYDTAFFEEQGGHLPFLQQVIDQILRLVGE